MALTPEDVVNKRFQPTKFREGYDQDEVDDFLDEVVVELRRLNQENEELRQRLAAAEARADGRRKAVPPLRRPLPRSTRSRAAPPPTVAVADAGAGAAVRPRRAGQHRRTCCSSPAASTRSTCARASRSATRSSPRATPPPPASSPRPRPSSAQQIGILDQERVALEKPHRRAAQLRARLPPEAARATSRASCATSTPRRPRAGLAAARASAIGP